MSNLELTKEEILRNETVIVAQKLFKQYGLTKTTMEDIAKAMGRGKSTLYYYYKSKEEIFEAVIEQEIAEVIEKIKKAIDKETSAENKLIAYFKVTNEAVKNMMNLYNVVLINGELANYPSFVNKLRKKHDTRQINLIRDILITGTENKEFTVEIESELELISYIITNAHRSLMVDLVLDDKIANFSDKLSIMVEILIRGLRK